MRLKILTAIAALLASVSAFTGELDGKAIICMPEKTTTGEPEWYEFKDGEAIQFNLGTRGTTAKVLRMSHGEYEAEPTIVTWGETSITHRLDRVTLEHTMSSSIKGDGFVWRTQCEVAESLEAFTGSIEAYKQRRQEVVNQEMRNNRI